MNMNDMRQGRCPLCSHHEIIESETREFSGERTDLPMCAAYDPRWVLDGQNPSHGHGALFMYICERCGYTQWFAEAPATIPIGEEYKTRIIKGTSGEGPFR